ncbi:MAG TPA: proton-conducting transporter membrane subunit [Candidatus Ozemobacteraceae bacterium]|nr:proton-conducting transporter membrane subunit [Candidatus Ozemobacteraceae bacterium]
MVTWLLLLLIAGPILFGFGILLAPTREVRVGLTLVAAGVTAAAALYLSRWGPAYGGIFVPSHALPILLDWLMIAAVIAIGWTSRNTPVLIMGVVQACIGLVLEFHPRAPQAMPQPEFVFDQLSLMLVLITSVVGALVLVYAIGYMDRHEHHGPHSQASQGQFFFFLTAFLGAMNGLVLANDLRWLSAFWEATTLCSFFLIGHDRTPEANQSARRAIIINVFGGMILQTGWLISVLNGSGDSLIAFNQAQALIPVAFLVVAALTKSAQLPFQSWLLGAMLAPTPVSALLHSSTMVNAGVYLVMRMAPGFGGTRLATVIAMAGAFTFMAASALAVGQSNGKKVLAYSTIANLGLIITCAGMSTPLGYAAAFLLIVFHAITKGLLFICMGTIEQAIGSRDIEDMHGLMNKMPFTTVIAIVGMIAMLMPPFGVLLGKWIAIESAVHLPVVMLLVIIGSALTVVFWAKWLGRIVTVSYHQKYVMEDLPPVMSGSMLTLGVATLLSGFLAYPLFENFIKPLARVLYPLSSRTDASWKMLEMTESFMTWPIYALAILLVGSLLLTLMAVDENRLRKPFLCGENIADSALTYEFRSIMDRGEVAMMRSYYFSSIFGEENVSAWANPMAVALILSLFGVIAI